MSNPEPPPRGVIISLMTTDPNNFNAFRTVLFNTATDWEYNSGRITIKDKDNNKLGEFPTGCYSGVAFKDSV